MSEWNKGLKYSYGKSFKPSFILMVYFLNYHCCFRHVEDQILHLF